MKKIISFNIWNFIEIKEVNEWLDEELLKDNIEGVASDIGYKINNFDENGDISIEADFELDTL